MPEIDRSKRKKRTDQVAPELLHKVPPAPKVLKAEGKKEWRRIIKLLMAEEIITVFDTQEVLLACLEWETYIDARQVVADKGYTWESEKSGYTQVRPEVKIANDAFRNYSGKLALFGMNPYSRTKIKRVAPVEQEQNAFSEI